MVLIVCVPQMSGADCQISTQKLDVKCLNTSSDYTVVIFTFLYKSTNYNWYKTEVYKIKNKFYIKLGMYNGHYVN